MLNEADRQLESGTIDQAKYDAFTEGVGSIERNSDGNGSHETAQSNESRGLQEGSGADRSQPSVTPNTIFTEDAAAAARARLKAKLGRLDSGIDPESQKKAVADGIEQQKAKLAELGYGDALKEFFGDKAAPGGDAVFSQGLFTPASMAKGLKPSLAQLNFLVSNIQKIAKTALPISIVKNPGEINGIPVNVTPGENPPGAVIGGRIYLFSDNIRTVGEAQVTLFHELFHFGIQKVIPAEQYAALMRSDMNRRQTSLPPDVSLSPQQHGHEVVNQFPVFRRQGGVLACGDSGVK